MWVFYQYVLGFLEACWFWCCPLCCDCKSWFHKGLDSPSFFPALLEWKISSNTYFVFPFKGLLLLYSCDVFCGVSFTFFIMYCVLYLKILFLCVSGPVSSSLVVGGREETAEAYHWEQVAHSSCAYKLRIQVWSL